MIAAAAALLAAALAAAVGLAAAGPVAALVAATAVVQLLVAARWFLALDVPGAPVGAVVGGAAAIAADVAVAVRDDRRPLTSVTAVLGLSVLAALLHQLSRRDGRDRLTASLAATVFLGVVAALGSSYLGTQADREGGPFVVAGVLAAAAAVAGAALPRPALAGPGLGLAAGVAAGAVVGQLSDLGLRTGLLVGLGATAVGAVSVAVARRMARPDPFVTAGLPLLLAAPVTFLLSRLLAP